MWKEIDTATECCDCTPPFSFYFDIIERFCHPKGVPSYPLHRVCTLARKMVAKTVIFECVLGRAEIREEIDDLDAANGGDGEAQAVSISFYSEAFNEDELSSVSQDAFIGQVVIINYSNEKKSLVLHTYVYEALIKPPTVQLKLDGAPKVPLLNNYICSKNIFNRSVLGQDFQIETVYYAQQNGHTSVCAHATLKMILNSFDLSTKYLTTHSINQALSIGPYSQGLELKQVLEIIEDCGIAANITDCENMEFVNYNSLLHSVVESGFPALLVFSTSDPDSDHVVAVFGHTRNSDEWHPQGMPGYTGPPNAAYYPSSSWADHYLIHDDNFGPHYTLAPRSFEIDDQLKARSIIALYPIPLDVYPHFSENLAAIFLGQILSGLKPFIKGKWSSYLTAKDWKYLLRTVLISKEDYISHLFDIVGHDQSKMSADEIQAANVLPSRFWITEFSLPNLYAGNRSKLGEILIDAIPGPFTDNKELLLGFRMPEFIGVRQTNGTISLKGSSLVSHAPIYQSTHIEHEW